MGEVPLECRIWICRRKMWTHICELSSRSGRKSAGRPSGEEVVELKCTCQTRNACNPCPPRTLGCLWEPRACTPAVVNPQACGTVQGYLAHKKTSTSL